MTRQLLIFLLFFPVAASFSQNPWKEEKKDEGVIGYSRMREEGFKEVRITTRVSVPMETILEFLLDYDNPSPWKHNTKESRIVAEKEGEKLVYYVIETPWPLKNRDFYALIHVYKSADDQRAEVAFEPVPFHQPPVSGLVRMRHFETSWQLEKDASGQCSVQLTAYANPEGLPVSLVNMFMIDTPFKTMKNLVKYLSVYQLPD